MRALLAARQSNKHGYGAHNLLRTVHNALIKGMLLHLGRLICLNGQITASKCEKMSRHANAMLLTPSVSRFCLHCTIDAVRRARNPAAVACTPTVRDLPVGVRALVLHMFIACSHGTMVTNSRNALPCDKDVAGVYVSSRLRLETSMQSDGSLQVQQLQLLQQQQQRQNGFNSYGPAFISHQPALMYARDMHSYPYANVMSSEYPAQYAQPDTNAAKEPATSTAPATKSDAEAPPAKASRTTTKKAGDKSTYASRHQAAESRRRQRINDR